MAEVKSGITSVIVMCGGILEEVHYFDNVEEAQELFNKLVKELNEDITEEELESAYDSGNYEDGKDDIWIY